MHIEANSAEATGLKRLTFVGLLLGIVGAAVTLGGLMSGSLDALQSYFFGWSFWLIVMIGCQGIVALHHTVRGAWGLSILRIVEAGSSWVAWVVMGLLFLPIWMNLPKLYHWADPHHVAKDHILQQKAWFLNPQAFAVRLLFYLVLFAVYAYFMRQSAIRQDETHDERLAQRRTNWSAPYLVLFGLAVTLLATDLWMSLDPHWFSHIFGAIFLVSGTLAAFAIGNILVMSRAHQPPYAEVVNRGLSKDLGNWLFVFTCVWAYFSFSQYIIIYSGNLPEFTTFFYNRQDPTWGAIGLFLMFGAFLAPFVILMSPKVKATPKYLVMIATWILLTRIVDAYWVIMPFMRTEGVRVVLYDLTALIGIGGIWLALVGYGAQQARILPVHDPRLKEAYEHA